ncbi:hypothetical protein SEA_ROSAASANTEWAA_18 [Streptomyces phage RosaAsantewaa]|nr:hypothetical protein SEA_ROSAASANTEWAA_18 [Streptomyces phage RosaAsantewaa]
MISFTVTGSTNRVEKFLRAMVKGDIYRSLDASAQAGVSALASATPVDSGLAADSWSYEIEHSRGSVTIKWLNTNVENGFPVAIMLQYGHGTRNGGYVQGQDYINPAMRPIFDKIANDVWKAVTSA